MEEQFEILKKEVQEIRSMLESLKNSPHPQTIFVTGTIIFLFFFFFLFSIFQFSLLFSLQEMVVTAGALGLGTNVVNHRIVVENHFPAFDVHWLPVIFIGQSLLCPSRPLCCWCFSFFCIFVPIGRNKFVSCLFSLDLLVLLLGSWRKRGWTVKQCQFAFSSFLSHLHFFPIGHFRSFHKNKKMLPILIFLLAITFLNAKWVPVESGESCGELSVCPTGTRCYRPDECVKL